MSDPYLSEIRIVSFNFAPKGWTLCNGQLLPINSNQALFSLLGTNYGGDGRVNFALPNLRGQVPIHMGNGHTLGEVGGSTAVTLNTSQMPQHNHFMMARNASADSGASAVAPGPTTVLAQAFAVPQGGGNTPVSRYSTNPPDITLAATAITTVGGSQAHTNMMPYLVLTFCIALVGIFPSQN